MTDEQQQFDAVLDELRAFLADVQAIGVNVVIVGGQVIALEALAAGRSGAVDVATPTGVVLHRGYSMEPDLLFDVDEAGARSEGILDILRRRGFARVRTFRWRKEAPAGDVLFDLFVPPDSSDDNNPAGFTRLPGGEVAVLRPTRIKIRLRSGVLDVAVADPVGFLAMKLVAKRRLRPEQNKDSFDLYAYVSMKGAHVVGAALRRDTHDGPRILAELEELLAATDSPGVLDVLNYAGTLEDEDRALVARAVVDLIQDVRTGFV